MEDSNSELEKEETVKHNRRPIYYSMVRNNLLKRIVGRVIDYETNVRAKDRILAPFPEDMPAENPYIRFIADDKHCAITINLNYNCDSGKFLYSKHIDETKEETINKDLMPIFKKCISNLEEASIGIDSTGGPLEILPHTLNMEVEFNIEMVKKVAKVTQTIDNLLDLYL